MNFSPLILPLLVFLIVSLLTGLAIIYWDSIFGAKTLALKKRLEHFSLNSQSEKNNAASGGITAAYSPQWFLTIKEKYPKIEYIELLSARSGYRFSVNYLAKSTIGTFFATLLFFKVIGVGFWLACLLSVIFSTWPWIRMYQVIEQRKKKFEEQLPDGLDYISRALKAGHSLTMAIHLAAEELEEPVGYELKVTSDQINFGLPFNEALNNLSLRINSADLNFFVIALNIQRDTGGNLTELLANLAKVIRERIKLSGKIRVLSSEGRFSGIILFLFPFIIAFVLNLINPKYMSVLWTTPIGNNVILVGLVMMLVGGYWISQIVKIKV